jgi:hypothetical protein
MKDPIVEEVRAARQAISEECGHDLHTFFERQKVVFAEWKGKIIRSPFHPEWHAPKPSLVGVAEERAEYAPKDDDKGKA